MLASLVGSGVLDAVGAFAVGFRVVVGSDVAGSDVGFAERVSGSAVVGVTVVCTGTRVVLGDVSTSAVVGSSVIGAVDNTTH